MNETRISDGSLVANDSSLTYETDLVWRHTLFHVSCFMCFMFQGRSQRERERERLTADSETKRFR